MIALLIGLHALAALFWVGGMAFAYLVVRPAAVPLEAAPRLALWRGVFARFLPAVGAAIVVLLATGYALIFLLFDGFRGLPLHVNLMQGTGILMMLVYLHLFFAPWRRFRVAVDHGRLPDAATALGTIRRLVATNLGLGILTVLLGATGRYW